MMQYKFDWDPQKASPNIRKHKITFHQATTVFRDPQHLSIYDEAHSESEERWITLGISGEGLLLVVIHTFEPLTDALIQIRIISARKATKSEIDQYQEANQ